MIEYDGIQHFEPIDVFGGEKAFKKTQKRDRIKNTYCKQNDIPLLRIPHWEFERIEELIQKILNGLELPMNA